MTPLTRSPLRRFVTDGLRETINSYTAGALPLHRFAWELHSRLGTLAELTELRHWRSLDNLHAAQHAIARIDNELRATGRANLTAAEEHALTQAIAALLAALARVNPPDPIDPEPALPDPVANVSLTRRARHLQVA